MNRFVLLLILAQLSFGLSAHNMTPYNLVWNSPSGDASGSMPIGNGELGANVWVEQNGDIVFYISSTDSWSETGELFKLGRVRVSITPSIAGSDFVQTLDLGKGLIHISGNGTSLDFFISSNSDVIYLTGKSDKEVDVKVKAEVWRDKEVEITPDMEAQFRSVSGFAKGETHFSVSPDKIVSGENDITVFHHNDNSSYEATLKLEKLQPENREDHDTFLDRCFGYSIRMDGAKKVSDLEMKAEATNKIDIKIGTLIGKYKGGNGWQEGVQEVCNNAKSAKAAMSATGKFWKQFWNRSYIEVETPDVTTGEKITSAYVLQRWVQACAGRGHFPIKFNGTIFTVDYKYTDPSGSQYNPDVRRWGGDFWWQNTRLPYHPMLKSGDYDMMKPFFEHYFNNLDVMKANARALCGAEGALSPETQTQFGTFNSNDYNKAGNVRDGNIAMNMFIRRHWDSSVEMVALMLDYYDYTGDKEFVKTRLVPYAKEMLTFYDSYYKVGEDGRLEITPTQSLETYWYDVVNDMPTVAGLNECVDRLKKLPTELSSDADKALWNKLDKCLPAIPVGDVKGQKEFLPAEKFNPQRSNCENPNLYPIFPFHLCNISTDNLQIGINSYKTRIEKMNNGWTQDGQEAARLGLTKEAADNLVAKIGYSNKNFRFPATWGPNFDWTPDQDHGSNLLMTLQDMVLQTYDGVDYILPAFPDDWGVKFKLHTFGGKVVKGHKALKQK